MSYELISCSTNPPCKSKQVDIKSRFSKCRIWHVHRFGTYVTCDVVEASAQVLFWLFSRVQSKSHVSHVMTGRHGSLLIRAEIFQDFCCSGPMMTASSPLNSMTSLWPLRTALINRQVIGWAPRSPRKSVQPPIGAVAVHFRVGFVGCRVWLCQKALCTNARFSSASQEQHSDQRWRLQCLFASMLKKRNYLNHAFHYSEFLWTLELRILKLDCVICLRRPWQSRFIKVKLSCYCMSLHSWPWKSMHRLPIQAVSGWIQICAHGFGSARSASLSHWSHCFAWQAAGVLSGFQGLIEFVPYPHCLTIQNLRRVALIESFIPSVMIAG